jgi:hypothetical protein
MRSNRAKIKMLKTILVQKRRFTFKEAEEIVRRFVSGEAVYYVVIEAISEICSEFKDHFRVFWDE